MDKILEKLAKANISESDLAEVKAAFDEAVEARVSEESDAIKAQADEYAAKTIQEQVAAKTLQLEELADKFCEKKAQTLAAKADKKIKEQMEKVTKAAEDYICKYFDEKFAEKYEEELTSIEESVITQLDKYLDYAIAENINPRLIEKTAVNECIAPIVKGIQNLFEEQFVPLNTTGTKKLKEARAQVAELEETLRKQINENMKLTEKAEEMAKKSLISEKTAGMSNLQRVKVEKFFEAKSFAATKEDIDDYCEMISEHVAQMRKAEPTLNENRKPAKPSVRSSYRDDNTEDFITEKFKKPETNEVDSFLATASRFID